MVRFQNFSFARFKDIGGDEKNLVALSGGKPGQFSRGLARALYLKRKRLEHFGFCRAIHQISLPLDLVAERIRKFSRRTSTPFCGSPEASIAESCWLPYSAIPFPILCPSGPSTAMTCPAANSPLHP